MKTISSEDVGFNNAPPTVMHIDLNSCFASVEQQANYLLRGKPIAVGAYITPGGCILAASYEAKKYGVETGMRVSDGRNLCPGLIILGSDPPKYRFINRQFLSLFREYTPEVFVKSIDEMILVLTGTPALRVRTERGMSVQEGMKDIALEIKQRINSEIGDSLRVSIGIAPNRYLAKIASGMEKPNGLTVIDKTNILDQLSRFTSVEELNGIKKGYGARLRLHAITTPLQFYRASILTLKAAFRSINGYYWWLRLHGWEADDYQFKTKSIGHSYALYLPYETDDIRLQQILCQLSEKMARRMRRNGYQAEGIHIGLFYRDWRYWHKGKKLAERMYSGTDLFHSAMTLLREAPNKPVRTIDVSCHYLAPLELRQQSMFTDDNRKRSLARAVDVIQDRWGDFSVMPGLMLNMPNKILDRIAFGSIKEMEESIRRDNSMVVSYESI